MNIMPRETRPPSGFVRQSAGKIGDADPQRSIARAAIARSIAMLDRSMRADDHATKMFPFDEDASLLLRAATAPTDTTNAAALVRIVQAILPMLAPHSAAARMFQEGPSVTWGRDAGAFSVPNISPVSGVRFVQEGKPKPVVQSVTTAATVNPHKIAGITVVSIELFAQANIEAIMQGLLAESAGQALDAAVFSTTAATAAQPAGLLNGVTALTAATGGVYDAMLADISTLGSAIGPIAGAGKIALIMNLGQSLSLLTALLPDTPNVVIMPSGGVPAKTVIAVALNAVVSAVGIPEFETATHATLQMDDAPGAVMTASTLSLYQQASVAVKMVLPASWASRSPLAAAYVQNVVW